MVGDDDGDGVYDARSLPVEFSIEINVNKIKFSSVRFFFDELKCQLKERMQASAIEEK